VTTVCYGWEIEAKFGYIPNSTSVSFLSDYVLYVRVFSDSAELIIVVHDHVLV
jgi:hypothetical protein